MFVGSVGMFGCWNERRGIALGQARPFDCLLEKAHLNPDVLIRMLKHSQQQSLERQEERETLSFPDLPYACITHSDSFPSISSRFQDSTAQWEAFQQEFRMEQEKNMEKLHQQMRQEREAREAQDAKVRMLEEDLLEQRKVANEKSQEVNRRRTAHNDELLEITAKFNREKRRLEEELDIERDTVRSLKVSSVLFAF